MKRTGKGWAGDALAELQSTINEERDSARWLKMSRALSRIEASIEEERKVTAAAMAAEKRLAKAECLRQLSIMAHDYPSGHRGDRTAASSIVRGRRLKQDARNKRRRHKYVSNGNPVGRPRTYPGGRAGRGGHHLHFQGEWVY